MKIWDRENKTYIEEEEYKQNDLKFLYETFLGRILLKFIFASRWFSKLNGLYEKSKLSLKKIPKFVKKYKIDMTKYDDIKTYKSFEEFFRRKRNINKEISKESYNNENLIAIADSKLTVLEVDELSNFKIKQSIYDIKDLVLDENLSEKYKNGICLIYRLSVNDYHRYIFLDDGEVEKSYYIKGKLHTVRPISEKYNVYSRNSRNISILNTKNFGKVLQIEIGAMLVGKIINHDISNFQKTQEKGLFDFGGSTIVQIFEKDKICIDEDIIEKSKEKIETKVNIGMIIGKN